MPRNGVDEDCSGKDAPYPRVNARIFGFFTPFASGATRIERVYAQSLPGGARVARPLPRRAAARRGGMLRSA